MKKLVVILVILLCLLLILNAWWTKKKAFPSEPITIICPWSPGGGTDRTARFISELLSKELGQPVNVVNKTGGDGAVGHSFGANAKPDGYTICNVTFELGSLKYLGYSDITPANFIPITQFNDNAASVVVKVDSPYNTAKELLDDIKVKPAGTFVFSGASLGSVWDLARIGLLNKYGIDPKKVKYIPTKGAAPAITELLGGHIDVITCSYPEASPQVEGGKLKCLGLMAEKRNLDFPEVPTLKEQGIDWTYTTWRGFAVPLKTPKPVIDKLIDAFNKVFETKEFKDFMKNNGFGIRIRNGNDFGDFMQEQHLGLKDVFEISGYGKK